MTTQATILRMMLRKGGYCPIPVIGKAPAPKAWQLKVDANAAEIELWEQVYASAVNTGILTAYNPTIDIDIVDPEAAEAIEAMARDLFEERGYVLVRIGKAPKRAIVLRTDQPFNKIVRNVVSPSGVTQKIEILGDGQQVVAYGTHPDTGQPYRWHGGEPGVITSEELPYVREDELVAFADTAVRLLIEQFGFKGGGDRPPKANGEDPRAPADWAWLLGNIQGGRELHDCSVAVAAKLIGSGMSERAAVSLLRGMFEASTTTRDDRFKERYEDLERTVRTAQQKYARVEQPPPQQQSFSLTSSRFVGGFMSPDYLLDGILQRRFFYTMTGKTGAGKTAVLLLIAAHSALQRQMLEHGMTGGRVLYLAGENPDDIRMRWIAMSQQMGFDDIDVHFIPGVFKISAAWARLKAEVARIGGVSLIIIDTGPAFFEGTDENDNKQAGDHARLLRRLTELQGQPCVIAACHPTKNASNDDLVPRGGGAFLNEVDGNLSAKVADGSVEISVQGKFRGPDFAPLRFQLRTVTHEQLKDTKGRLIPTVVASPLSEAGAEDIARVQGSREDEMLAVLADHGDKAASLSDLARACGWFMNNNQPYKMLAHRVLKGLIADKLVVKKRRRFELTAAGAHEVPKKKKQATATTWTPFQVVAPADGVCAHCGQGGLVYRIRDTASGVKAEALHEHCAEAFYGR